MSMTTTKTTPSQRIGHTLTDDTINECKATVWFLGLRLWIWKYHPHLRIRPTWNTEVTNEITYEEPAEVFFKHTKCIPVWNIEMTKIVYYLQYTRNGDYLGKITTLGYLLNVI